MPQPTDRLQCDDLMDRPPIDMGRIREAVRAACDRRIEQLNSRDEQHASKPPRSELLDLLAESEEAREIRRGMGRR